MRSKVNKAKSKPLAGVSSESLDRIEKGRIIAIVRGDYADYIGRIADALVAAGISALEVTLNSPSALNVIEQLSSGWGDRLLIGAGTVMNVPEVAGAAKAGARFIVSPNRNARVIQRTKELGMLSFPGALTSSEIVEAFDAGADAVKIFPAQMAPPAAIQALRAPLGDVRMIPTGGISHENLEAYLDAGAWAFGIGSELVNPAVKTELGMKKLFDGARELVSAIKKRTEP
jgi:2-dehydro-3-deoxyphosphogluconate aldolase / (4S)-4-hydroxy-2-oxoglutarate aldolase